MVALIAAHGSVAPNVLWRGGPVDPLILGLDDPQIYAIRRRDEWMLRIIDVRGALQSRGYSSAVRTELHLDVRDPIVSENQGRIVLEVGEGRAQVREGGDGSMRVDIGTLAGMFSGHLSPAVLRRLGQLDADDATIARATAIFAGPAPWMPDMF